MSAPIEFQYRFHAAGQGLFASGTLAGINSPLGPFHWVFDCGSVAYSTVLRPVVSRYRDLVLGDHLDLLCISHFDNDHVSGLPDLLDGLHVDTVVIPYYSQLERLVIGATSAPLTGTHIAFLSNPVAFILERAASVRRIMVVGGPEDNTKDLSLPERPPDEPPSSQSDNADPQERGPTWHLKLGKGRESNPNLMHDKATQDLAQKMGTQILAFTGSIETLVVNPQCTRGWEFLFFHKPIDLALRETLLAKLRQILDPVRPGRRRRNRTLSGVLGSRKLLREIKEAYTSSIQGREDINSTSLCVYTGPELEPFHGSWISPPWPDALMALRPSFHSWQGQHADSIGLLYTGDANLKPPENRRELRDFLTLERWHHIILLQVPHHGSKENWELGAAAEFSHAYSIFCADETHLGYKHPDREVVLDLIQRGPHLANKSQSWTLHGFAHLD